MREGVRVRNVLAEEAPRVARRIGLALPLEVADVTVEQRLQGARCSLPLRFLPIPGRALARSALLRLLVLEVRAQVTPASLIELGELSGFGKRLLERET